MVEKYNLKYKFQLDTGEWIQNKEVKIKNCLSEAHAKSRLEDFLKRKYINFKQLIVEECKKDINMENLFSQFGDIFGGKGNFGNIFGGK